jgi:hypothetical protein
MELNQSEKMLFALLCSALNTIPVNSALFADVSLLSWQSCYKLAVEQGVMALGRNTNSAGLFATPEGFEVKLGDGGREL